MRVGINGGVIREVRFCLFALALSFVAGCGLSNQPEETEARLYARVGKAFALVAREDVVEGKSVWSNASGFCAVENGTNYFYTSKHVVFDKEGKLPVALYATDMSGESMVLDLSELEVPSHNHDVVRIRVGESMSDGLTLARSSPAYGETLYFFGDALGAGVMNVEVGKVVAIGPLEFEHGADVIKGMSGGPVVNRAGEVVGLCQKGRRQDAGENAKSINAESKYLGRARQFGTNLNTVKWMPYRAQPLL